MDRINNIYDSLSVLIEERLENIEHWVLRLEKEFADYAEANPKGDDQWVGTRVSALEFQVMELRNTKCNHNYIPFPPNLMCDHCKDIYECDHRCLTTLDGKIWKCDICNFEMDKKTAEKSFGEKL